MSHMSSGTTGSRVIYIIRHGEKPSPEESDSAQDHPLSSAGLRRAAGLAEMFAQVDGHVRVGITRPDQLIATGYQDGGQDTSAAHRPYKTLFPLQQALGGGLIIETRFRRQPLRGLSAFLTAPSDGVTLVCWEHHDIPVIARSIEPTVPGTHIPAHWPGKCFDVVWCFRRGPDGQYTFSQIPQMLLPGDREDSIPMA